MPKSPAKWYPGKEPTRQINILRYIALNGSLSQNDAPEQFNREPSTISEALNIMRTKRNLIEFCTPPDFKSGERHKKFYKLTPDGLIAFISENPSPYEFWIALMWYCKLNTEVVNNSQLSEYYNLFIQRFIGESFRLRSCFFLTDSFDAVFEKWRTAYELNIHESGVIRLGHFKDPEALQAYKVFECLLENRSITIERIVELTKLTEQQVRKTLQDYCIRTQAECYHYIGWYESTYQTSRMDDVTTDFLTHLVIIPIAEKVAEGEGKYDNKHEKYELSLLGVLLMLATLSLRQRKSGKIISSFGQYYDIAASNYHDKLPLILGKWKLLEKVLKFDYFPSILDYLFLDKSEILSLSVFLGGNKEIHDNIKSAALSTISRFSMVYEQATSAIQSDVCTEEFLKSENYRFIQCKLDEIEILLRYSDLESFAKHMISKRPNTNLITMKPNVSIKYYLSVEPFKDMPLEKVFKLFANNKADDIVGFRDDLESIERTLADEFSLLFYIGLLRENNHKASDYPGTAGFINPNPNLMYPKHFLLDITRSDDEIRKMVTERIREAITYQGLALQKMNDTCAELEK